MSAGGPKPPVAKVVPKASEVHGERRVDDYAWLREKEDPDVAAYLEAENAYADAVMTPTEALQEALYAEMLARIKETDQNGALPQGRLLLLLAHRAGEAVPDPLPQGGEPRRAEEQIDARPQPPGRGQAVHGARRLRR